MVLCLCSSCGHAGLKAHPWTLVHAGLPSNMMMWCACHITPPCMPSSYLHSTHMHACHPPTYTVHTHACHPPTYAHFCPQPMLPCTSPPQSPHGSPVSIARQRLCGHTLQHPLWVACPEVKLRHVAIKEAQGLGLGGTLREEAKTAPSASQSAAAQCMNAQGVHLGGIKLMKWIINI